VKGRKRGEGETLGAELLTREVGTNVPRDIICVAVEYARVPARDRECSEHGEDVERGVVRQCVILKLPLLQERRFHFKRHHALGGVASGLAEGRDRDRWMGVKREGRQQLQRSEEVKKEQTCTQILQCQSPSSASPPRRRH
jgi:hypothetical protein